MSRKKSLLTIDKIMPYISITTPKGKPFYQIEIHSIGSSDFINIFKDGSGIDFPLASESFHEIEGIKRALIENREQIERETDINLNRVLYGNH